MVNETVKCYIIAEIQLNQIEVSIADGSTIGILAHMIMSLFVGIVKEIQATPLPQSSCTLQVIAAYIEIFSQVMASVESYLGTKGISKVVAWRPLTIQALCLLYAYR